MPNDHVIEVEGRFVDNISGNADDAAESLKDIGDEAKKAQKETDKLGKKKIKPDVDADTNKFLKKIRQAEEKARKFGNTKTAKVLQAVDKASTVIDKVVRKAKDIAGKTWQGIVKAKDSASSILKKVSSLGKGIAGKTWQAIVKIKDMATTPLSKIKNALFNIKTLIGAIAAGWAANQLVVNPIKLADSYSSAKIGFQTLLGEEKGQKMMDDLDVFAKATPYKSSEVIAQSQRMLAMGWEAEDIIKDMTTIGDAAAATGKGEQGLQQIVTALAQIKSKGKLSTEELNQLAEAGISAKRYIAEGLGYGSGDSGIAAMTKDLENGAISSGKALEALLSGMKEYQGMMETTANETASGLWSQITDTFEINIFRRWGQGLQEGAKKGFGTVLDLLNSSEGALESFGDTVYEIGKTISNWAADKLAKVVDSVKEITASDDFKNASLGGKVKMLWDGAIGNPLAEWWSNTVVPWWDATVVPWLEEKANSLGKGIGAGLTGGLLALLGFNVDDALADGASIGGSFIDGFLDGFDTSKITEALMQWASENKGTAAVLGAIFGAKLLSSIGGIVGNIKGLFGIGGSSGGGSSGLGGDTVGTMTVNAAVVNVNGGLGGSGGNTPDVDVPTGTGKAGGIKAWFSKFLGSTGTATVGGSGLLGKLASAGYSLSGGAAASTLSGGAAAAVGGSSILGAIMGALGIGSGIKDIWQATKTSGKEAKDKYFSGGSKIAMVGSGALAGGKIGAAIGSLGGPIGTGAGALIGAGIGGAGALFGGEKFGKWLSDATDEGGWINNAGKAISTFFKETLPNAWDKMWGGISDFCTETIPEAWEGLTEKVSTFFTETIPEKWNEFWDGVGNFFTETVPYALGYASGKVVSFFTETIPNAWDSFWGAIGEFFTETIPQWADSVWNDHVVPFFTESIPGFFSNLWSTVTEFFTETIPEWADSIWNDRVVPFFTESIPGFFTSLWDMIKTFFTETIPQWADSIWNDRVVPFFTETIPGFFTSLWDSITGFFTESLASFAESVWSPIETFFTETVPGWVSSIWDKVTGWFSDVKNNFLSGFGAGSGSSDGDGGGKARGGIVGGGSTGLQAFARGGRSDGGMVGGTTKFIKVNEEAPEMIIPLSNQRRERAVKLWMKTGELLGINGFARGGITSGSRDEGFNIRSYESDNAVSGGQTVHIDVGGITFEIHVDARGSEDVVETIKAKAKELAETLAGYFADALEGEFENTPLRA